MVRKVSSCADCKVVSESGTLIYAQEDCRGCAGFNKSDLRLLIGRPTCNYTYPVYAHTSACMLVTSTNQPVNTVLLAVLPCRATQHLQHPCWAAPGAVPWLLPAAANAAGQRHLNHTGTRHMEGAPQGHMLNILADPYFTLLYMLHPTRSGNPNQEPVKGS
jgi:hypothetical protein